MLLPRLRFTFRIVYKYQAIEQSGVLAVLERYFGKLTRKHQFACNWFNKVLVCFEYLDKSGEEVKSARSLEDRRASSPS